MTFNRILHLAMNAPAAPVNTVAPVASGSLTLGGVLSTTDGTWTGTLPMTPTYQWKRGGSNIGGATASTYTLVSADASSSITCSVTMTNTVGNASQASNTLTTGAFYQGPGDIVSGAIGWWSCARAYTSAYGLAGSAVMDLVDQAGSNSITINALSSGLVDVAAINTWVAAHSVSTIRVAKLYDQSLTGNHLVNTGTAASKPALTLSTLNSLPGMTSSNSAATILNTAGNVTQAQPLSLMCVSKRTTVGAATGVIGSTGQTPDIGYSVSANTAIVNGGTSGSKSATASDNAFHALQGLLNGASSLVNVDGADSATATTAGGLVTLPIRMFRAGGGLDGVVMEAGIWPTALTSGNRTSLNTNARDTSSGYGAY